MKKITFKRATLEDIDIFISIEENAVHPKMYHGVTDREKMPDRFNDNIIYLIKKDDIVVGNIEYRMEDEKVAYISGLVVHSDFQGQGIAHNALKMLLKELKDIQRIYLVTHPHNNKAIRLYLSFDFKIESWIDNYHRDGEPRIILGLGEKVVTNKLSSKRLWEIFDDNYSVRTRNCLKKAKIDSVLKLTMHSERDLLAIQDFGKKSLIEIKSILSDHGLWLKMHTKDLKKFGLLN